MADAATVIAIIATILSAAALLVSLVQFLITRRDQRSSAAEQRLQALEVRYAEVAQPAMAQLDAIKMLYPDAALWAALLFQPPAVVKPVAGENAAAALAKQQLRASQMELLIAEQRARNAVKGFWDNIMRLMEERQLPPSFGRAVKLPKGGYHLAFSSTRWTFRANNFRELVEPFDIANFYRLELDRASGHYLAGNRPKAFEGIETMWRQYRAACMPLAQTYNCTLAWAKAMEGVRPALQPAAEAGSGVERLPPPELPPDRRLPLVRKSLV